ncbi:MAG: hypothetical protein M3N51_02215 [Actinomycetota bacterium]|nr:hypothetical protein [Actinomycetota bacterium]
MSDVKYRLIYVGLALGLVAVVAIGLAFGSPEGRDIGLPEPVEGVSPLPGETVLRQARLEIDMPVGYRVEIFVDGQRIPESEVDHVEATGLHSWSPGPGRLFTLWTPGEHSVRITWDSTSGLPDPGEFHWSFRVF